MTTPPAPHPITNGRPLASGHSQQHQLATHSRLPVALNGAEMVGACAKNRTPRCIRSTSLTECAATWLGIPAFQTRFQARNAKMSHQAPARTSHSANSTPLAPKPCPPNRSGGATGIPTSRPIAKPQKPAQNSTPNRRSTIGRHEGKSTDHQPRRPRPPRSR